MLPTRISGKIASASDGCWVWIGAKGSGGYGIVIHDGRRRLAHVVVYELMRGPVPKGLELDHLCRNQLCVSPDHVEPVTHRENVLRGFGPTAINARKTHCVNGHEFTEANTYYHGGRRRQCRTCNSAAAARVRKRRAA